MYSSRQRMFQFDVFVLGLKLNKLINPAGFCINQGLLALFILLNSWSIKLFTHFSFLYFTYYFQLDIDRHTDSTLVQRCLLQLPKRRLIHIQILNEDNSCEILSYFKSKKGSDVTMKNKTLWYLVVPGWWCKNIWFLVMSRTFSQKIEPNLVFTTWIQPLGSCYCKGYPVLGDAKDFFTEKRTSFRFDNF